MKKIIFTIIVVIVSFVANSQTVSEIVPSVAGDKIQINFTVSGLKYFQEVKKVGVSVSRNGGDFIPIKEITGDNWDIYKDGRYKIIWDQLKEVSFTGEDLIFEITLLIDKKKKSFFIMLAGNDVTPIGLRLGLLGKVGFYVEARSSLLAMQNPGYTYVGSTIIDYDKPGFYEFSDKEGWQSYTALVGVTYQLFRSGFVYAGCGYGIENYIMEFNEYEGSPETSTGTGWAKSEEYSNAGVELDAGIMVRINKFVLGAGGTALNFKSFGWTASFGYSF